MKILIGIAGGSASGKTLLALKLKEIYKEKLSIISYDMYCLCQKDLSLEERAKVNFDIPSSYDGELLYEHLLKLKNNLIINAPIYDFKTHSRTSLINRIEPTEIILVEGILFLNIQKVYDLIDFKIYMDAREETRFKRRLKRDIEERGRDSNSVYKQFYDTVAPMHEIYVEPYKNKVDFVFSNDNNDGLDVKTLNKLVDIIDSNLLTSKKED